MLDRSTTLKSLECNIKHVYLGLLAQTESLKVRIGIGAFLGPAIITPWSMKYTRLCDRHGGHAMPYWTHDSPMPHFYGMDAAAPSALGCEYGV